MRNFIVLFLLVYLLLNFHMAVRTWQALQPFRPLQIAAVIFITALSLSFIITMRFDANLSFETASIMHSIGTTWFVVVIYCVLILLAIDLLRFANHFFHFLPSPGTINYQKLKQITFFAVILVIFVTLLKGHYNFNHPEVKNLDIILNNSKDAKKLKITAASDLHLGFSVKKNRLKKHIELMNQQNADVILLLGDVVDRSLVPVRKQNMHEELSQLRTKYGTYAIAGNHDGFDRLDSTKNYLEDVGIKMLSDTSLLLADKVWIVGRKDRSDKSRLKINDLTENLDKKYPIILLDHQPYNLDESEKAGVDLFLAGHTHAGQIFPNNLIVKHIYELAYGYMKKGKTHYYISSGLGLWGPQFRILSKSEIVNINLVY